METTLHERAAALCELCGAQDGLDVHHVPPSDETDALSHALLCSDCRARLDDPAAQDTHHWRCLATSMWSEVPAVQVLAWRILSRLSAEDWARDLLDTLYLDDATLAWARALDEADDAPTSGPHKDSHGAILEAGDTVTLIKDLVVKGGGFTAKRGTAVRGIGLVHDNPGQIEGRVNGQQIVILTQFVKKST
ncbi:MAG: PhnA domain-containing protein [Planctomycetes bacterium]|nr:PhnA domain-containing protein [Planctomycetota bacterium]MCB9903224.1 PhnA domain-containing protein [Planctomycetota bacterium]